MKTRNLIKTLALSLLLVLTCQAAKPQEIGLRYGSNMESQLGVDGVFPWKQSRVHANLSLDSDIIQNVGVAALYDFTLRPTNSVGLNYYMGIGPVATLGNDLEAGGAFELGMEYTFRQLPITIGGDWRPSMMVLGSNQISVSVFGINARYVFM